MNLSALPEYLLPLAGTLEIPVGSKDKEDSSMVHLPITVLHGLRVLAVHGYEFTAFF